MNTQLYLFQRTFKYDQLGILRFSIFFYSFVWYFLLPEVIHLKIMSVQKNQDLKQTISSALVQIFLDMYTLSNHFKVSINVL